MRGLNNKKDWEIYDLLIDEYLDIARTLKNHHVPFSVIIAHPNLANSRIIDNLKKMGIAAAFLPQTIREGYTSFPRDILIECNGRVLINPETGLSQNGISDERIRFSPLGEGGSVLKSANKIFLPDPCGFKGILMRNRYETYLNIFRQTIGEEMRVEFLPFPFGFVTEYDGVVVAEESTHHLDRVAALVKGKGQEDFLIS